jgi:hypothetical protein
MNIVIAQRGKMKKVRAPRLRIQSKKCWFSESIPTNTHTEDGQSWPNPIEWAVQDCLQFKKPLRPEPYSVEIKEG